jgi:hypothetical protein
LVRPLSVAAVESPPEIPDRRLAPSEPSKPAAGKARELRFGYQRTGTLLIAKQQGILEKRLNHSAST